MAIATSTKLKTAMTLDPEQQSIQTLLGQCISDWGTPEANRELLLPFGLKPLDKALYGMDTINGEMILIQGPEKQRKSTLVANIVVNYMMGPKPVVKPFTVIDTLESGMTPGRYRDTLISIVATRLLFTQGHRYLEGCPICGEPTCRMFGITPEFLRYNTRSKMQEDAIQGAVDEMRDWPLHIYGASLQEGDTRNLITSVIGTDQLTSRWQYLIEEKGMKVVVTDHLQQYSFPDQISDYEKQLRTVAAKSDVVAKYKLVNLEISQVSLNSQKDAAAGLGKMTATGGRKAAQEATSTITVNYEGGSGSVTITLEDSRKYSTFTMTQKLEDTSGCFYGEATVINGGKKSEYRPGMEKANNGRK